jgi:hypothetical protein
MEYPRFAAETFIRAFLKETDFYSSVFHTRITKAFEGLEGEAEKIQEQEYAEITRSCSNPEYADPSYGAEEAYFAGVDFYLATDAVRQGLFNLMIAGLFHLVEQQSYYLATRVLSRHILPPDPKGGFEQLKKLLQQKFTIDIASFKSWTLMDQLRLVANTVKHGDGRSAQELMGKYPDLFKDPFDPNHTLGLLPCVH